MGKKDDTMKQTYPIKGMHCHSCEVRIAEELEALPGVQKAEVSIRTKTATITAEEMPSTKAVKTAIRAAGYEVGYENVPVLSNDAKVYRDAAIGVVAVTILVFIFVQLGLGNAANVNVDGVGAGVAALVIGLTAGFSTCMALIGGLVLGISSKHAESHPTASPMQKFRPHLFFNLGRVVSFTVLGGLIGAIGAAFQLNGSLLGLLTIGVGIVMLVLGLQLTDMFPRLKGSFSLPSRMGKIIGLKKYRNREYSHKNSFLLGAATFFLPCGFTQAMQLFAVSTGSWTNGALIMGLFAVGTMPGLLGIGGLTSIVKGAFARRFFRVIGVVVVVMALVNVSNGLSLLGAKNWLPQNSSPSKTKSIKGAPIVLRTTYTNANDIVPSTFTTKVGRPTTFEVEVKDDGSGCMSTIMIIGVDQSPKYLKAGETLQFSFTPERAGTYDIACAMGIKRGSIKVEE